MPHSPAFLSRLLMIHDLSSTGSLLNQFVSEIRDVSIQADRLRFRHNLERIAALIGYEISRQMRYRRQKVATPLGTADCWVLEEVPILGTILRAGLAMHQGLLGLFDRADNAIISAYRKHRADGSFDIELEYVACPPLDGRVLILCDPMLATGASIVKTIQALLGHGRPREIHLVCAIAARAGVDKVQQELPWVDLWVAAIDAELDRNFYIVPGLGDAGDLAYGEKAQR